MEEPLDSKSYLEILSMLAQVSSIPYIHRTDEEHGKMTTLLETIRFFHKAIADEGELSEFIKAIAPYAKYHYYPRGSVLCHEGDMSTNFGIIMKGRAIVYQLKDKSEMDADNKNQGKASYFRTYWEYLERKDFSKKFRKLVHSCTMNEKVSTWLRQKTVQTEPDISVKLEPLGLLGEKNIESILDKILNEGESLVLNYDKSSDLSLEEKLLLLNHNSAGKSYFLNGIATHKAVKELREEDFVSRIGLTMKQGLDHTVIAAEDVHVVSVKTDYYLPLFERVGNLKSKKEFIKKVLSDLKAEELLSLCSQLEERVCVNCESIYRQEEDADAIYIVKTGEVQLVTSRKDDENRVIVDITNTMNRNSKPNFRPKQKLIVASIQEGGMFGEEEVISQSKRKYAAVASQQQTLVYIIRSDVYHEIFQKHWPGVCKAFENNFQSKVGWRNRLEAIHQNVGQEFNNEKDTPEGQNKRLKLVNIRLMNDTEAKYRKMNFQRPELVYETKPAFLVNTEQRESRVTTGKIAINTYGKNIENNGTMKRPQTSVGQKRRSGNKSLSEKPESIQPVKTKLFRQNQVELLQKKILVSSSTINRDLSSARKKLKTPQGKTTQPFFFPNPSQTLSCFTIKSLTPRASEKPSLTVVQEKKAKTDPQLPKRTDTTSNIRTPVRACLTFNFVDPKVPYLEDISNITPESKKVEPALTPKALQTLHRIGSMKPRRMVSMEFGTQENNSIWDKIFLNEYHLDIPSQRICTEYPNSNPLEGKQSSQEGRFANAVHSLETEASFHRPQMFVLNRGKQIPKLAWASPRVPNKPVNRGSFIDRGQITPVI